MAQKLDWNTSHQYRKAIACLSLSQLAAATSALHPPAATAKGAWVNCAYLTPFETKGTKTMKTMMMKACTLAAALIAAAPLPAKAEPSAKDYYDTCSYGFREPIINANRGTTIRDESCAAYLIGFLEKYRADHNCDELTPGQRLTDPWHLRNMTDLLKRTHPDQITPGMTARALLMRAIVLDAGYGTSGGRAIPAYCYPRDWFKR